MSHSPSRRDPLEHGPAGGYGDGWVRRGGEWREGRGGGGDEEEGEKVLERGGVDWGRGEGRAWIDGEGGWKRGEGESVGIKG